MRGLLELVLEVNDLDKSLAFYRGVLELTEVEHWPPPRVATWLSIGRNAVLGLWPSASGGEGVAIAGSRGGSHVHFAIYVEPGSLSMWQEKLGAAGFKLVGPVDFAHGNRSLFVSDPDGNIVELADWIVDWSGEGIERPKRLPENPSQSSDEFAKEYRALRIKEGWAQPDGREDPTSGNPTMWRGRLKSVSQAAAHLSKLKRSQRRLVILDVGSGGGWASRFLEGTEVIAIDLIQQTTGKLTIRADMRRLPLLSGSIDGALFAASLHYADPSDVIPEVARVVRSGGLVVAVDSPIYPDVRSLAAATIRSNSYYLKAGFPRLAERYRPLEANELRRVITESGFRVEQWKVGSRISRAFRRLTGQNPGSLVVARRI